MAAGPSSIGVSGGGPAQSGIVTIPLFHAAWLFACGVLAAHWLWIRPSLALLALIPIATLCILAALRAQRIAWIPLAAMWVILGAWCAEMEPHPAPSPVISSLSDGLVRSIEGSVTDIGSVRNETEQNVDETPTDSPAQRIDVRLSSIEQITDDSDKQIPADGSVRLTVRWPAGRPQSFQCGQTIRADARLLKPETYHDAGTWNRVDYLLDEGISATATIPATQIEILAPFTATSLRCRLANLQHIATARLLTLPAATRRWPALMRINGDDAAMLAAMIAGDRTFLTHSLRAGFERTGSFHMLVVSGLHLAIVAGCILWIARRIRLPRLPATLLTIAASFVYALFSGFALPVQRSFWMVALYLLGRLFYRDRRPLNVIGFAALCMLAASPRSLFDASFEMTLLAVVAIAGIAVPLLAATIHPYSALMRDLRLVAVDVKLPPKFAAFRVTMRMIAQRLRVASNAFIAWRAFPWTIRAVLRVFELVVVSVIIELAMALPMAINFHRITVFALPVNFFILPLLAALVPAALLTLLALAINPAAASVPAALAAIVLHAGVGLVRLFGSLRFGDLRVATPLPVQAGAFWLLLTAAIVLAVRGGQRPWYRRAAFAALLLAAGAAIVPRPIQHPRNAVLFEAIDVGQGDSLLLISPNGKTLLVDAGGFGGGPRQAPQDFDIGEEVVSDALWSRGIRHLDAVALSHAHSDHMGGMPAILRNFHPGELWVGENPHVAAYDALLAEASALHTRVRSFHAGDAFPFGAMEIAVKAPDAGYRPGAEPANNDSLVLHVAYGATSAMLEGDAEAPIEQAMLAEPGLESTLLKVGHHGSATSTSAAFLARVAPQWAIISDGLRNRYGHPRQEVLAALESAHTRTFRTDLDGASCFLLDGRSVTPDYACGWRGTY
jgi:competence protein ComEC